MCVPKKKLDIVFLVDSRARHDTHSQKLWQIAFGVVARLAPRKVRVRFLPEVAEESVAGNELNLTAKFHGAFNSPTMTSVKVGQKSSAELMASLGALLSRNSPKDGNQYDRKIGIYMTDGVSSDPVSLIRTSKEIRRRKNIELFAVGIGEETKSAELAAIVAGSKGSSNRLFRVENIHLLRSDDIPVRLARALCSGKR